MFRASHQTVRTGTMATTPSSSTTSPWTTPPTRYIWPTGTGSTARRGAGADTRRRARTAVSARASTSAVCRRAASISTRWPSLWGESSVFSRLSSERGRGW
ncbi:hypothetical protein GE21DRAFT_8118 [Neurospora crassa]|uniref:Uncharacterized protein n=1 Tax=Neurospora crassa (strain ATCC 24698 / 74-OR23-1A / CBS 708.71 / DSM 1257 / FGSC 987) TaxID=367110 RepID=Q1K7M5_NEUCR|nr:hypothetical protein NCU04126 [Neurospora crassa OR74A]EAA32046.2 hypothetical protein NCU04126 [Neurospora crassa OR74A]KHE87395.1 hypothetical protein GE21DRAFT_8118 [Neurospora crassa]|eukprot:XP_961282.2 hypothetical protein NCU04126 [Neurospora crassa OR74A]